MKTEARSKFHKTAALDIASFWFHRVRVFPLAVMVVQIAGFSADPARAETFSAQRIRSFRQMRILKKITVGPDDQFQAAVDPTGRSIVFTHRADLVAHLRLQDLASGQMIDLLPLDADSQDASFSASGKLVFTYYKFNARGDICYVDKAVGLKVGLTGREIQCLRRPGGEAGSERSSPFWRSENEIGYVVRDINTQNTRIVIENIKSPAIQTVAEGKVWAPAMRPSGRFLSYIEIARENGKRALAIRDLATGEVRHVALSLPGLSGFSSVSEDERYLYFSHFLNDSNQDKAIDGRDNAVVYRLKIDRIFAKSGEKLLPEQLTSVESSCSFPRPFKESLFVTCAFEDTLDIYQIPADGAIPSDWDKVTLESALRTSRSYQERLLVLNNLQYRFAVPNNESILSTHLLAGDLSAALYYLENDAAIRGKEILKIYLEARQLKTAQPPGEMSRVYREGIQELRKRLESASAAGPIATLKAVTRIELLEMNGDKTAALTELGRVRFSSDPALSSLERYLYFQQAEGLYANDEKKLLATYAEMICAPEFSEETRLYYTFNALHAIQGMANDTEKRVAKIESLVSKKNPADANLLLSSEVDVLHLIEAKTEADKNKIFRQLDAKVGKAREDYFLRRAINVRAIVNFNSHSELRFVNAMASSWLRDTARTDTEFIHARQVVSGTSLDQAYGYLGQKNYDAAIGFFFSAVALTDDLESHAGYMLTTLRKPGFKAQRKAIDESYRYFLSHNLVADNFKYAQAYLAIVDAEALRDGSSKGLDEAINKLEAMVQDRDSAVRYLLLGYSYLEKMRRSGKGVEFDNALFQKAHRCLMLAYDQGRDNDRVRSAALVNLGLLHQRVNNFGMSAKFFALRKRYGFESPEEQSRFAWVYARSLFHAFQPEMARRELAELPTSVMAPALRERLAFYSTLSNHYDQAAELYSDLLRSGEIRDETSQAKVQLSFGYALLKLKRFAEAQTALRESARLAARLKPIPIDQGRALTFEPLRIRLVATGFLSQIGTKAERLAATAERGQLLEKAADVVEDWEPAQILNSLQMADLVVDNDPQAAMAHAKTAVKKAHAFAAVNGYLGRAVYRATVSYLALANLYPDVFTRDAKDEIEKLVGKSLEAMAKQSPRPALLEAERLKVVVLWGLYRQRVLRQPAATVETEIKSELNSESAQQIREEIPPRWKELEALAEQITR